MTRLSVILFYLFNQSQALQTEAEEVTLEGVYGFFTNEVVIKRFYVSIVLQVLIFYPTRIKKLSNSLLLFKLKNKHFTKMWIDNTELYCWKLPLFFVILQTICVHSIFLYFYFDPNYEYLQTLMIYERSFIGTLWVGSPNQKICFHHYILFYWENNKVGEG